VSIRRSPGDHSTSRSPARPTLSSPRGMTHKEPKLRLCHPGRYRSAIRIGESSLGPDGYQAKVIELAYQLASWPGP
jgi:hypothetical protein